MRMFSRSAILALCATLMVSCYYPGYDSGYGDSYGYSGGGTTFVHTSSDRWFYDSSVRCYYDRTRGCYYDPWLNGYYPRGYCPTPVTHVPHPYGWNGRGACPLPRSVNYRQIDRYQDRLALLRAQNHAWARNVQAQRQQNIQNWQNARARQAAQFANNRTQPTRGQGTHRPSQPQPPTVSRNPGWNRPNSSATRPAATTNPVRPQGRPNVGTGSQTRPQVSQPSRQPSRPSPSATRPGYRQPVATPSQQPSRRAEPERPRPTQQPARTQNRGNSTPLVPTRPGPRNPRSTFR